MATMARSRATPKILLVHTGGTLGMAGPGALKPAAFTQTLRTRAPELFELADLELDVHSNLDSAEMQPEHWPKLARHLHERLADFDGAVVTHGTDTLAYTASALSFMLRSPSKPIVVTGSQRPLAQLRSDARLNLIDAVTAAIRGPREVTVCFGSRLFRGNRVLKMKVDEYDAFASPNHPGLGTLGVEVRLAQSPPARGKQRLFDRLEPRVFLLKVFPGLDPALPLSLLPSVKGLVVEAYGEGTFALGRDGGRSLLPLFTEAEKRKIPVVVVSQAPHNSVRLGRYESSAAALEHGAIEGGELTAPAALVKLMVGLPHHRTLESIRRFMRTPIAGEMSDLSASTTAGTRTKKKMTTVG